MHVALMRAALKLAAVAALADAAAAAALADAAAAAAVVAVVQGKPSRLRTRKCDPLAAAGTWQSAGLDVACTQTGDRPPPTATHVACSTGATSRACRQRSCPHSQTTAVTRAAPVEGMTEAAAEGPEAEVGVVAATAARPIVAMGTKTIRCR